MIYLDNAATSSPKPQTVIKAVERSLREFCANPGRSGHDLSQRAALEIYECRKKVCEFFNGPSEDKVIFTPNCTHSLNYVLKGLLSPGDHVIASSMEHNAVARPLHQLAKQGVEVDVAEVIFDDMDATLRSFGALIQHNTKLIVCTHASNVTGMVLPIKEIGALCRQYGILFVVDAAQTAGIIDIDMEDMNIDFLCIAPHKGLYAPMGTGILIARSNLPKTVIEGGTGTMSIEIEQPEDLPERLESGTLNLPGIMGISAGIDFVKSKTLDRIYNHELKLMQMLYDALESLPNIRLYTSRPQKDLYAPVLSFNIGGMTSGEAASKLNNYGIAVRAGLHCAPMAHKRIGTLDIGTVRVCPSVFTSPNHIHELVNVIKRIIHSSKNYYIY
ncbi:MAG TPA: aminotransferase class V-fold PLP-dependent enzyme [Clostridiales bacterium]|nr:aminotransferase class V-fold PLP-dependent enzyme [Clostridiales bacterium]